MSQRDSNERELITQLKTFAKLAAQAQQYKCYLDPAAHSYGYSRSTYAYDFIPSEAYLMPSSHSTLISEGQEQIDHSRVRPMHTSFNTSKSIADLINHRPKAPPPVNMIPNQGAWNAPYPASAENINTSKPNIGV
jgi:hypothetical protein